MCSSYRTILFFCVFYFAAITPLSAKLLLTPFFSLSETYYDNIDLSENGNRELVSRLEPGISMSYRGPRLNLSGEYSYSYIDYFGPEFRDRSFNSANGTLSYQAVKNILSINVNGRISYQVIDPSRVSVNNNALAINNLTQTRQISLAPELTTRFGKFASGDLTNTYRVINFTTEQLNAEWDNTLVYRLQSGSWFKKTYWQGIFTSRKATNERLQRTRGEGRITYQLFKSWSYFVEGSAELFNFDSTLPRAERLFAIGEGGVTWAPSRKIKFEIGGGATFNSSQLLKKRIGIDRYTTRYAIDFRPTSRSLIAISQNEAVFGEKRSITLTHSTRKTRWSSSYSETITTPLQQRIGVGNNAAGSFVTERSAGELPRQNRNLAFLAKKWSVNASLSLRKTVLTSGAFWDDGDYFESDVTDRRLGVNAGGELLVGRNWRLLSDISVQKYYLNNLTRVDNLYRLSVGVVRSLKEGSEAGVNYAMNKRGSSVNPYVLNKIELYLQITY